MKFEPWLSRAARVHPRRTAIDTPAGACSYGELELAALNVAGWLGDRGVGPGDRVAVALPPGPAFAAALHGAWRLGATVVPVDLRLGSRERARDHDGHPHLDRRAGGAVSRARSARSVPSRGGRPGRLRSVIHTSGSTGAPRPVSLSFANLLWSALGSAVALGLDPEERWLCALPLSHVGGLSILVRSAIYGTTAVFHERFDTEMVLPELARSEASTLVSLVPTTLARLLDAGLREPSRLRCALIGGGPTGAGARGSAPARPACR